MAMKFSASTSTTLQVYEYCEPNKFSTQQLDRMAMNPLSPEHPNAHTPENSKNSVIWRAG
jgi:hypothetical protein